jgi:hypothetical protein
MNAGIDTDVMLGHWDDETGWASTKTVQIKNGLPRQAVYINSIIYLEV